jgi:hypothetical protein
MSAPLGDLPTKVELSSTQAAKAIGLRFRLRAGDSERWIE